MPLLLIAHDKPNALARRMEARQAHMDKLAPLKASGQVLYAAALLDDKGDMAGSMIVFDLPREEVDAYIKAEPYVLGDVWDDIRLTPCRPAPMFAK